MARPLRIYVPGACLPKESFPEAMDWAGPLDSLRASDILQHWRSLQLLQKAPASRLRESYRDHTRLDSEAPHQRLRSDPRGTTADPRCSKLSGD